MHRDADGAPGDRRRIGDEIQGRGLKRLESQSDHEGAGDGDGSAESRGSFNERTKAEGDEEQLQPAIGSDGGDRLLHDFELPGGYGDVVQKDRGHYDPNDFQQAEAGAVHKAGQR
jgi:hypothetical protein